MIEVFICYKDNKEYIILPNINTEKGRINDDAIGLIPPLKKIFCFLSKIVV